jgi:hypothetical protein
MNTPLRRVLLAVTVLIGGYVGIWAEFFPNAFYTSFPGFGLHWIDVDGAFNEHLIRDVGSLYIALGAGSLAAIISRSAMPGRVVGLAWAIFGVLHFGYHVRHLKGSSVDIVGNIMTLGVSALLGLVLLLPLRGRVERQTPAPKEAQL